MVSAATYGRAMADGRVFVIDRVVTKPGCARGFISTYLAEYAPGARSRGMTLCDVLVTADLVGRSIQCHHHHLDVAQRAGMVGDDVGGPAGPGAGRMVVADR